MLESGTVERLLQLIEAEESLFGQETEPDYYREEEEEPCSSYFAAKEEAIGILINMSFVV